MVCGPLIRRGPKEHKETLMSTFLMIAWVALLAVSYLVAVQWLKKLELF